MSKEEDSIILKRFGKYLLLDHLVDGGMAKICRGRYLGEQADKIVAIKMIQSQYSSKESFVKMFLDEIKVTFGLIHPNIAQTYDTGITDGQVFIVMEYVDGKNLKQYLDKLRKINRTFPIRIATYIVSQACQALSYSHNFTNKLTGQQVKIIHRDISPHNIMVTYDGVVKVIDFGIAKAETNTDSTKAGTIKGKLSYLAPEYLEPNGELDHRYDQFALGITLWELLCSRKLFSAKNELAVLKLIQTCKVPAPSTINPNVPPELDEIVLKALSKNKENRYENMEKFSRALVKFLYSNYSDFNPTDLANFAKTVFKNEIKEDRLKLYEYGKIDIAPYLNEMKNEYGGVRNVREEAMPKALPTNKKSQQVFDFGFKKDPLSGDPTNLSSMNQTALSSNNEKFTTTSAIPANSKDESDTLVMSGKIPGTSSAQHNTSKSNTKMVSRKDLELKEDKKSIVSFLLKFIPVAAVASAAFYYVSKPQFRKQIKSYTEPREPASVTQVEEGSLHLTNINPFLVIKLNGQPIEYRGLGINLALNKSFTLEVLQDGKKTFKKDFILSEGQRTLTINIPKLEDIAFGELETRGVYPRNTILRIDLGDKTIERELPLEKSITLPTGTYQASIVNLLMNTSIPVEFVIEENRRVVLPFEN